MDKIRLEISQVHYDDKPVNVVDILINNKNLIDILREIELSFAEKEGHPEIAGGYMGLSPKEAFFPSKHLLGEGDNCFDSSKTHVLVCGGCGEEGCWPLLVKISVTEDRVIWSDFEQPHRGTHSKESHWKYDKLGSFVFDRKQYEKELSKLITRENVIGALKRWQKGEIDVKELHNWAALRYLSDDYEVADWEGDDSVINEVLCHFDMAFMNLVTKDDVPAIIEFLNTPVGKFNDGSRKWEQYTQNIDYNKRKQELKDNSFYAPYCKTRKRSKRELFDVFMILLLLLFVSIPFLQTNSARLNLLVIQQLGLAHKSFGYWIVSGIIIISVIVLPWEIYFKLRRVIKK